jgi:molybdenum-dependent DNA-binding transcriptional regulator ModE
METLLLSRKERRRLKVMEAVQAGELILARGAEVMGMSYRQAKRIWKRYRKKGDAGLVHRARGRRGTRRTADAQRRRTLRRYQQRYGDFGPTLAAEYLAKEGMNVDHETLRRWLLEEGLWKLSRGHSKHRQWRERKPCLGQMVQMDGSHHDWFEGRRANAVLMVMIDDATNRTWARFSEQETTEACYDVFEDWVQHYGLPLSLYVDRDSIYRCEREPTVAEQVAGQEPQTQFKRAMEQLGVELILAHSPQAKGRVERRNGLLQDRLVKALRLAGIDEVAAANRFLKKDFLPELNRAFTVQPASPADVHRPRPQRLDEALGWEEERVVRKDWTVAWEGRWFQIDRAHEGLSLADRNILVRRLRGGEVQLLHKDKKLRWKELPQRPAAALKARRRVGRTRLFKPGPEHPWRRVPNRKRGGVSAQAPNQRRQGRGA